METPTDNEAPVYDLVYTVVQDVSTDKRNYADTLRTDPMTPEAMLRSRLATFAAE
ncbi:MAG: hypothetical protein H7Y38_18850 [Armatimonadetes bacterium]|nr:hypothetical protein [Armatimonadota bacterium]